jgi:hypothetical protein
VRLAREHGIEIAVRGGGHSAAGLGVRDGALVIDLSLLRSTTVNPQDHTVGVDAGAGPVPYDLADATEVKRWYRELLPSLPEELNGRIALLTIPPAPPFPEALWGRKACGIVWCYTGPHDRAEEVLELVRSFGSTLVVGLQPMPFTMPQSAFDALYPAGLQWYWRADFFSEISDVAIDVHVKYGAQLPTGHSTMHLYPIDGAASRVPASATAFAYRSGGNNGIIAGVDPDPANAGLISQWAKHYWEELRPTSACCAYINFLLDEGQDRVRASYRGNYDRLAHAGRSRAAHPHAAAGVPQAAPPRA